jgi:ribosomal protein L11 methyltransferase
MSTYSLSVCVNPQEKEIVIANGYLFGTLGFTEESLKDSIKLTFYYSHLASLQAAHEDITKRFSSTSVSIAEVADRDWNAEWKASMQPAYVAEGIWVSPLWLTPRLSENDHWIKIEPKTAFGTGHHATTRLAAQGLKFISKMLPLNYCVLDIGTGTGILCFIAKLWGAGFTMGIDIDPMCAGNIAENRINNSSSPNSVFFIGDLHAIKQRAIFDCVIMNMIQTESQPLLNSLFRLLKSPGYLVWSGILLAEKESVIAEADKNGLSLIKESSEDEWWGGIFRK